MDKPGMPGMGLQMPGAAPESDTEARLADLEARIQKLEDEHQALLGGQGGATGSPPTIPPTGQ